MEGRTFDEITRKLATGMCRRRLVTKLAGGVASAGVVAITRSPGAGAANDCSDYCAAQRNPSVRGKNSCKTACQRCKGDANQFFVTDGSAATWEWGCCPPETQPCTDQDTFLNRCGTRVPTSLYCERET